MVGIERFDDEERLSKLVALINRAYASSERGLWREGTSRIDAAETAAAVRAGELLVARGDDGAIRGCARVRQVAPDSGEVGLVASATGRPGTGVGRALMHAAEERMRSRGLTRMRLSLLVPRKGTHPEKERLRAWYERLGYRVRHTVRFEDVLPHAATELAVPCDLLEFEKPLTELEPLLGQPVAETTRAAWGFQNRTDLVTLATGERVVVQRYRRREDGERRRAVLEALHGPAARAGIAIPHIRAAGVDGDPPYLVFDALPGVPVPEADGGIPALARAMGELLAAFRRLPAPDLRLDDLWADPERLAAAATGWAEQLGVGAPPDAVPLFAHRPVVLAHGDFAPVNILVDGGRISGLLDFESLRLADPLFDAAWWAWSVKFAGDLEAAWPAFLAGAGIDADEPQLRERIRALQVLRMLELLAAGTLERRIADIVADRLRADLAARDRG